MKKVYTLAFVLAGFLGISQQDLQLTQYMFNRLYYNPGVTGSGDAICVNAVHRSQWVGFEGAPTSQNLNVNVPIAKIFGGVGLKIVNDQIGYFQNFNAGLSYGYQHTLNNGATIGAGIGFEMYSKNVVNPSWMPPEGEQSLIQDIAIPAPNASGISFDMSFGLYYSSPTIWGGVSSNRLLESSIDMKNFSNGNTTYINRRHYYVMGGYNWQLPSSNIELRPSTLIKTDLVSSPTVDVNITGVYNNKFWGGVTYRLSEAAAVNIGYQFMPSLKAGYSYDIPITEISQQGGGSHEIFLQYCFKVVVPPKIPGSNRNPRFL